MLISTLVVGVTPFFFTLGCILIDAFVSTWPHWQGGLMGIGDMVSFGLFALIITIPCGLIISLISQSIFRRFYPDFLLYFWGMMLVGIIAIIVVSILLPVRMHHEYDINWAAALIGISTLTGSLTTYALNARCCPPPAPIRSEE